MVLSYNIGTRVITPDGVGTIVKLPQYQFQPVLVTIDGNTNHNQYDLESISPYYGDYVITYSSHYFK